MNYDFELLRSMARYLLSNRKSIPLADWTVQGFGFMRLRIADDTRLHVWDGRLRIAGVSDIHDNAQWGLHSMIICGKIRNVRFVICKGDTFHVSTIKCGVGGMQIGPIADVGLYARDPEIYYASQFYSQKPEEIHRTIPLSGTVSIIKQHRRGVDTARVFFPRGTK